MKFYIVDCFAREKYQGNQLAVFLPDRELTGEEMQKIALEVGFSEITFLYPCKQDNGGYRVRIFTPDEEIPFAGHPTLGTAFVIWKVLEGECSDRVLLNLDGGTIPVSVQGDVLTMAQNPPEFGETIPREALAKVLGLEPESIREDCPIQWVSTGLAAHIVPLVNGDAVRRCKLDHGRFQKFLTEHDPCSLLVFSVEDETTLKVRVFVHDTGFKEDPATGSANGDLAAYLIRHGVLGKGSLEYTVYQGEEARRPSILHVRAGETDGIWEILVGGSVHMVAQGDWA